MNPEQLIHFGLARTRLGERSENTVGLVNPKPSENTVGLVKHCRAGKSQTRNPKPETLNPKP